MSMQYIRDRYGVPAKRGKRVEFEGKPGTIVAARGGHLRIRLDEDAPSSRPRPYHPLWHIDYLDDVDYSKIYDERMESFYQQLNGASAERS